MKLFEILFTVGAIFVMIGLFPAIIDSVKTIKDILYDFKDDKSFMFEMLMFIIAIICFVIGIIVMIIEKVYNG